MGGDGRLVSPLLGQSRTFFWSFFHGNGCGLGCFLHFISNHAPDQDLSHGRSPGVGKGRDSGHGRTLFVGNFLLVDLLPPPPGVQTEGPPLPARHVH